MSPAGAVVTQTKNLFWREAATLILATRVQQPVHPDAVSSIKPKSTAGVGAGSFTSDSVNPDAGQGSEDYKILMLKRNQKSSFMPSRMVFPGGTLAEVDHSTEWYDLYHRLTKHSPEELAKSFKVSGPRVPMISKKRPTWGGVVADFAFRVCAIRETFEEAGVLLVVPKKELAGGRYVGNENLDKSAMVQWNESEGRALQEWRRLVQANAREFFNMCAELQVFPNVWALHEWSNWLTPTTVGKAFISKKPMRFDTMFYICCLGCESFPFASADETETVLLEWKQPSEFLSDDINQVSAFESPQIYELLRLTNYQTLQNLHTFTVHRSTKGLECYLPVVQLCADGYLTYLPGDCCYPVNPDFEGSTDGLPVLDETVDQLLVQTSKQMHRFLYRFADSKLLVICNKQVACGHSIPDEKQKTVYFWPKLEIHASKL